MTKKEQAVNLQYFEKKAQNANRKEKFYLDEEEVEFIQYHPVFSKSKRTELIKEFFETARYCGENNIDYFKNYGQEMEYLEFLIVKYFTDIKDMLKDVDVEGHLAVKDTLIESSFTEIMVNEVFHIDEISKVSNDYNVALTRLGKINQELEIKTKLLQQNQNAQKFQEKKIKAVSK